jgi:hypothetical protein
MALCALVVNIFLPKQLSYVLRSTATGLLIALDHYITIASRTPMPLLYRECCECYSWLIAVGCFLWTFYALANKTWLIYRWRRVEEIKLPTSARSTIDWKIIIGIVVFVILHYPVGRVE